MSKGRSQRVSTSNPTLGVDRRAWLHSRRGTSPVMMAVCGVCGSDCNQSLDCLDMANQLVSLVERYILIWEQGRVDEGVDVDVGVGQGLVVHWLALIAWGAREILLREKATSGGCL